MASHIAYLLARLIVTLIYGGALFLSLGPYGERPFAWTALLFTLVYAILMLLLWLYERFPPPK